MFLKEGLQLDGASLKVLKQTVKMGVITSPSSSYYFPLSQLEWLYLEEVNNSFLAMCFNTIWTVAKKNWKKRDASKAADIQDSQKELFFLKFSHLEFFIQQVLYSSNCSRYS